MTIKIGAHTIYYEVSGTGKPVLLLHGWMCNIETFRIIINELEKTNTVYALDFPGQGGKSSTPELPMTMDDYTALTAAFIEEMGIAGTDIINHSFGGRVSILLGAKYPKLVGKIVFTDAAGIRPKRSLNYYIRVYSYKLAKWAAKHARLRKCLKWMGIDVAAKVKNAGSEDYKALSGAMRKTFSNIVNEDLTPYLKEIKAPSLMIYGREDADTPVRYGEIMERNIKDSGLVVLENAGHYSFLDQFPQYIRIVKTFLEVAE